ncbi:hypothetical protein G6L34_07915 [Agrobacterium tumefaciens]|uniref:Uncharacterized protein n=1 Tax=Agrobacterium deltaense Zutra 3/1 TaxID=1183427 RepID=A0A1S7PE85_9HYPH|nr:MULTISPECIES: hypothetical protein [Agrobacterium]NTA48024.1 hypothetical protein [Agrobacterium tumefaciens]CUX20071.1 hypothetical protein AGR7C_Cc150054 [Agrobacterium deltaense Zutra 3/1]
MDREELRAFAIKAKSNLEAERAFDTPENERRLIDLLATRDIKVTKRRKKAPNRYAVVTPTSRIEPASLLDLNDMCIKLGLV